MGEELQSNEFRRESLKQRIEKAQRNPLPIVEHNRMSLKQAPRKKGYVKVQTLEELREAFVISRETKFSIITDECINFHVEHEGQRIEAAKKIYGEGVPHSYGIQFLQMEDGTMALVSMYSVDVPPNINKGAFLKNSVSITEAPERLSARDKKFVESQPTPTSDNHRGK